MRGGSRGETPTLFGCMTPAARAAACAAAAQALALTGSVPVSACAALKHSCGSSKAGVAGDACAHQGGAPPAIKGELSTQPMQPLRQILLRTVPYKHFWHAPVVVAYQLAHPIDTSWALDLECTVRAIDASKGRSCLEHTPAQGANQMWPCISHQAAGSTSCPPSRSRQSGRYWARHQRGRRWSRCPGPGTRGGPPRPAGTDTPGSGVITTEVPVIAIDTRSVPATWGRLGRQQRFGACHAS